MLRPSFSAEGIALYGDEDLRFVRDDASLSDDERLNLLRTNELDLRPHRAALIGSSVAMVGFVALIGFITYLLMTLGGIHLDLVLVMALTAIALYQDARVARRNLLAIRNELRIRAAVPEWYTGRLITLRFPRMKRLIAAFGSDWANIQGLMLEHGTMMSGVMNGVVEIYLDTIAKLSQQCDQGLIEPSEYYTESTFAAQTAYFRYTEMWEDWSGTMDEMYTLSCNQPH